jgi:hypothetical protein
VGGGSAHEERDGDDQSLGNCTTANLRYAFDAMSHEALSLCRARRAVNENAAAHLLLAVALLAAGCAKGASSYVAVDLLALFPFTDAGQSVAAIDLGSAAAAAHVRDGWSQPRALSRRPRGPNPRRHPSRAIRHRFGQGHLDGLER